MTQDMKKWLGILLALLLLPVASAFAQPDLTVSNAAGLPGAIVNTPVSFANTNPGTVVSMSFNITYNPALVTPGAVTAGATLPPHSVSTNISPAGTLVVLVTPPLQIPLPNVQTGVLFTIPWTIAGGAAPGSTPLALTSVVFSNAQAGAVPPGTLTPGQITINAPLVAIPNVVGLTQAAAQTQITNAGLVVGTVTQQSNPAPSGQVISQSPAAGTNVAAGSPVNLVVSSGPAPVTVPNVVGLTQAVAQTQITNAGLVVGTVTQQSNPAPAGQVISQNPAAGANVAAGSPVNLVVSSGPAPVGAGTQPVPTLSEWALLLLSLFLGGMVWRTHTRRA